MKFFYRIIPDINQFLFTPLKQVEANWNYFLPAPNITFMQFYVIFFAFCAIIS